MACHEANWKQEGCKACSEANWKQKRRYTSLERDEDECSGDIDYSERNDVGSSCLIKVVICCRRQEVSVVRRN